MQSCGWFVKNEQCFFFSGTFHQEGSQFDPLRFTPGKGRRTLTQLHIPKPYIFQRFQFFYNFLLVVIFKKNCVASSMVIFNISSMFLSWKVTSKTSFLKRFPLQVSHSRCTSAMNCISIVTSPSPLQVSHLPPSTLKEKCFALKPLSLARR